MTFGAGKGRLFAGTCPSRDFVEEAEGGRGGGRGDCERGTTVLVGVGKTEEMGVRDFIREDEVGMVRRSAAGFEDGVEGRVGGTLYSRPWIRLAELACTLAREEAVGALYPAWTALEPNPEPDA